MKDKIKAEIEYLKIEARITPNRLNAIMYGLRIIELEEKLREMEEVKKVLEEMRANSVYYIAITRAQLAYEASK